MLRMAAALEVNVANFFDPNAEPAPRYTLFRRHDVELAPWRQKLVTRLLSGAKPTANSRLVQPVLALAPKLPSLTWSDHLTLRERVSKAA